jgi:hypothetical protein
MDKEKEIYNELGEQSALSYIKNSHRLLSKVYHPNFGLLLTKRRQIAKKEIVYNRNCCFGDVAGIGGFKLNGGGDWE